MSHRAQSTAEGLKTPHTVSLKVLRLSRPSLVYQYPLPLSPTTDGLTISPKASLAYSGADPQDAFVITPILELPATFGAAHVGETFSCTLCANNELDGADQTRSVSGVRISAEMQTPSNPAGVALDMAGLGDEEAQGASLAPGQSLQKILRFELKEEGNHILAVTVTYSETQLAGEGRAASGRVRTFRKLYQFVAQQQLGVRTKAGELPSRAGKVRYALEAQLENVGEQTVCLEAVELNPKAPFRSTSLNWDADGRQEGPPHMTILNPRDVMQVAFLLEQGDDAVEAESTSARLIPGDKRTILGQLSIQWRSAMGDRGSLSTGWLTSRRR